MEEAEVTGLVALRDQTLLTVGWNQKIVLYDFCEPGVCKEGGMAWE